MELRGKFLIALVVGISLCVQTEARLHFGYYGNKCPQAESTVKEVVKEALKTDIGLAADLLRMHFHDCFVRGCDGSILLDSTKNNTAEKDSSINNPSLEDEAFEVIDKAKAKLEATCKGVVSCADIIAFVARDGIEMVGGPHYEVPSGRRDGRVSKSAETFKNLPRPHLELKQLTKMFANKGFTQAEMVTLSGAHTIGVSHCNSFDNRLYSFSKNLKRDPSLNPTYAKTLKRQCPGGSVDANITVNLDPVTPTGFDNKYYKNILSHRVLFTSDQTLLSRGKSKAQVKNYATNPSIFKNDFIKAMVKLGKTDVLTGNHGEIRHNCRVVN